MNFNSIEKDLYGRLLVANRLGCKRVVEARKRDLAKYMMRNDESLTFEDALEIIDETINITKHSDNE